MNSQVQMGTVLNILFKMCKSLYKCLIIKTDSVKTWNSLVIIFCFVLYFDDFNFDVRVEKHALLSSLYSCINVYRNMDVGTKFFTKHERPLLNFRT